MHKLCEMKVGEIVEVKSLEAKDLLKERLMALGLVKGSKVKIIRKGPKDNLVVYKIRGAMIALRKEEASLVYVISNKASSKNK